jgi:hypothetical protein
VFVLANVFAFHPQRTLLGVVFDFHHFDQQPRLQTNQGEGGGDMLR